MSASISPNNSSSCSKRKVPVSGSGAQAHASGRWLLAPGIWLTFIKHHIKASNQKRVAGSPSKKNMSLRTIAI
jgi:hypothetical protein